MRQRWAAFPWNVPVDSPAVQQAIKTIVGMAAMNGKQLYSSPVQVDDPVIGQDFFYDAVVFSSNPKPDLEQLALNPGLYLAEHHDTFLATAGYLGYFPQITITELRQANLL